MIKSYKAIGLNFDEHQGNKKKAEATVDAGASVDSFDHDRSRGTAIG